MILVTGGAGFIGSNFIYHLIQRKQEKIVILDNTVLYKRVHSANLSYTPAKASTYQSELLKLLNKSIYSRK